MAIYADYNLTLSESEEVGKGWAYIKTSSEIDGFCNSLSRKPEDLTHASMQYDDRKG